MIRRLTLWPAFQQRLGNESMRRFDCCALCLQRAREPLACSEGHLFCKECVYTDLRASAVPSVRRSPAHAEADADLYALSGAEEGH
jgi:nitric oxide synthase-interacting protein